MRDEKVCGCQKIAVVYGFTSLCSFVASIGLIFMSVKAFDVAIWRLRGVDAMSCRMISKEVIKIGECRSGSDLFVPSILADLADSSDPLQFTIYPGDLPCDKFFSTKERAEAYLSSYQTGANFTCYQSAGGVSEIRMEKDSFESVSSTITAIIVGSTAITSVAICIYYAIAVCRLYRE
eukprot:TRINITY_DN49758_c0_g1_i1.p1 TRINITY_DN49758_c0_g1~~TRINITY_DN49758_c0_g1_i1.p1  ORF type:complete len:178 (+),score=16.02 TRINITY_DN49758_c0_g1_i1:167-700(+)